MRTFRQSMYAVLAIAVAMVLGAGVASAAYDQGDQDQEQQYQNQQQDQYQEDQGDQPQQYQARNLQLERQIARQLRTQGFGEQGEIMILATGDRVILLGNVPDRDSKSGAERAAKQVPGVQRIDNRLHVTQPARQVNDTQLERDTNRRLPDRIARNVRVQAQNGTITLQGNLNNWKDAADAIDAAFAAGARQVNSQITVGMAAAGAGRYGGTSGAAGGYAPSYGYTPGTSGQQGSMGGATTRASASDLRLAQQVAQQLQQQLPPGQNVQTIQPQSIYVMVQQGTVTLHGYVQSRSQKQQAEQIARSIEGIQNVNNHLTIFSGQGAAGGQYGPGRSGMGGMGSQDQYSQGGMGSQDQYGQGMAGQGTMSDRRLAQTIQQQLQSQFPGANINVRANQGTVTLQGTVPDVNQKQQAEQYAYSMPGVQNVQNNLTVSGPGGAAGQSGSYPPQGYVPGQQSQQGMSGQTGGQQDLGGTTSGQQATVSPSDLALARQVAQKLQQQLSGIRSVRLMRPGTIYVMASQGTIMLDGWVQDRNVMQQVTRIARSVPGVQNVQSMLKVSPGAGGLYPSYGYVPGQGQKGTESDTGMSGRSSTGGAQFSQTAYGDRSSDQYGTRDTSGQGMQPMTMSASDFTLAQQVAQKLQQQLPGQKVQVVRPDTIYVMASQGTVMLHGFVSDPSAKQRASQIAQSVSGVQNVKNSLGISSGAGASSAFGYIPGQEDESMQPSGTNRSDTQEFGGDESDTGQFESDESDTSSETY